MKKYATALMLTASLGLASAVADDEKKKDRPAPGGDAVEGEGRRDGDRERPEGRRDGDRERPEGQRDGERPRPEGRRDGDRPKGDRPPAPRGPGGMMEMVRAADSNGDKKLSLEEWKAAAAKRAEDAFKRLDADGDGFVTPSDMEKLRERMGGNRPGGDRPGADRPEGRGPREGGDERAGGPRRPARPDAE